MKICITIEIAVAECLRTGTDVLPRVVCFCGIILLTVTSTYTASLDLDLDD